MPSLGQLPAVIVSMGSNFPSIADPCRLKYHATWFKVPLSQVSWGVTPDAALRALTSSEAVNVLSLVGRMPCDERNV